MTKAFVGSLKILKLERCPMPIDFCLDHPGGGASLLIGVISFVIDLRSSSHLSIRLKALQSSFHIKNLPRVHYLN